MQVLSPHKGTGKGQSTVDVEVPFGKEHIVVLRKMHDDAAKVGVKSRVKSLRLDEKELHALVQREGKVNTICKDMSARELLVKNHFGLLVKNNTPDHELKVKVTFKMNNFELQDAAADGKSILLNIAPGKEEFCWLKPSKTDTPGSVSYKVTI